MGRKLNPLEEAPSDTETNSGLDRIASSRSWSLLQQIAQQLSISPDEFSKTSCHHFVNQIERPTKEAFNPVLALEHLDLLEAFTRIEDPQERLRCLQVVRDAAKVK